MVGTLGVRMLRLVSTLSAVSVAAALAVAQAPAVQAAGVPYAKGDIFAGVGTGLIKHFDQTGVLKDTLNTGTGCSEDLGMAFDSTNNLYATASFGSCSGTGHVVKFDNMGNLIGPFGGPYSASTESITTNAAGHLFVGQPDGTKHVVEMDAAGTHVADHAPAPENRGTDWIDLAADQCTLFYTSEGIKVKRFNICTDTQLPDFATIPNTSLAAFGLRIRPNGEVLVATTDVSGTNEAVRFDKTGAVVQTYTVGKELLFALNLDPDGTSFWTGGYVSGNVFRIDIATGAILTTFNAGKVGCCLSGLALVGEIRVATDTTPPSCTLTGVIAGPPKQLQITAQDNDGGLKAIIVTKSDNASTVVPAFTVGTKDPVVVTSTKLDQSKPSAVGLKVTDMAGNVTLCDPTLVDDSAGQTSRVTIDGSEGHVTILNNGLSSLTIWVNGRTFTLRNISGKKHLSLDISSALHKGNNRIVIRGRGHHGTSATFVFSS
jgi:hypothetical protein